MVPLRTPAGLAVRTAGENPAAVEAQGIDVTAVRIGAVMAGSAFMGIGGAFLTMSAFNSFFFDMVNGRGWICIALVVFGSGGRARRCWARCCSPRSMPISSACSNSPGLVPYQVFLMLPYVLSILALIVMSRRAAYPRALMVPYRKGER